MPDIPLPISLGILSWGSPKTLRASLQSLAQENFFSLFADSFVFFQEITDEDREIARQFGLRCAGAPDNLGILGGMKQIAQTARCKYTLHLENDLHLTRDRQEACAQLSTAVQLLQNGSADYAQLIDRKQKLMGADESADSTRIKRFLRYYPAAELNMQDSPSKKIRRLLNPAKAMSARGNCLTFSNHPELLFPRQIANVSRGCWLVKSQIFKWSNLAPLYRNQWFLQTLLPFAESNVTIGAVNNKPDLEHELKEGKRARKWWKNQRFNIAVLDGLFQHSRLDRHADDSGAL